MQFGRALGVTLGRQFVTMTENLVLLGAGNKQLLMYATFLLMAAAAVGIFFLRRGVQEDQ